MEKKNSLSLIALGSLMLFMIRALFGIINLFVFHSWNDFLSGYHLTFINFIGYLFILIGFIELYYDKLICLWKKSSKPKGTV